MNAIRNYITAALMLVSAHLYAQQEQKVTIEQATVFLKGAELVSTATVTLPKGESEVVFTNIAGNVTQQSLAVGADKEVTVMAATFQNNYLNNENLSPKVKAIQDSIENVKITLQQTQNKITVINEQIEILKANRNVGGQNTGLSVAELQRYLDLVQAKNTALLNDRVKLSAVEKKANEMVAKLQRQLEEEQQRDFQPGGRLLVKFYNNTAVTTHVKITYVVPNAGWEPTYDIKVAQLNDPVNLFVKANVYQNSGVKWNNVHLVLSTGNPTEGAQSPVLGPLYVMYNDPVVMEKEVVITSYKVPMANRYNSMAAAPKSMDQSTMDDHVAVDNAGINTTYDIDLPYTIVSDGQNHLIAVKQYQLPATYKYVAVPKRDNDAFLQAAVTNWEDLDLLPAKTNIFYEGYYVGEGSIDVRNLKDTLTFSLGRDKKIVVKREQDKEKRSTRTIGSNVRDSYAYTLSVRNTRKQPIHLQLQDQVPVSNDKDIVVENREADGAEVNETTGLLIWNMDIQPNETKKVKLAYTVKYPKDRTITNAK